MTDYPWLSRKQIDPAIPLMRKLGVSAVARSSRGFLAHYTDPASADDFWVRRRHGFIKRHMAQVRLRGESLWKDGQPTRRALALVAWAYHPEPQKWAKWLANAEESAK